MRRRVGHTDVEGLLAGMADSDRLGPFRRLLACLGTHDREHGSDLVCTLEAYFEVGENTSREADRLFLHRNSIPYRLACLEELTGLDLKDHRATLVLRLGLLATEEERGRHR
jgi:DNA-binding PucR family transcriptional regulator